MSSIRLATDHRQGIQLAAIGVVILSVDALLVRLADSGPANVLFWRGLFMALSLTFVFRVLRGRWVWQAIREAGTPGWLLVATMGLVQILFITALKTTTVANVVIMLAAAPLFAAVFSGLFLGEWVRPRTWIAMTICLTGIAVVFSGTFATGNWLGDSLAVATAVTVGANLTQLRRAPGISRLAVLGGGAMVACLAVVPFAAPLDVPAAGLAWLAIMGLVQLPLAMLMMTEATRYMPSAEVALFLVVEAVLGTYWVWLFLAEEPPAATLVGGAVIITTLIIHSWLGLRPDRRR